MNCLFRRATTTDHNASRNLVTPDAGGCPESFRESCPNSRVGHCFTCLFGESATIHLKLVKQERPAICVMCHGCSHREAIRQSARGAAIATTRVRLAHGPARPRGEIRAVQSLIERRQGSRSDNWTESPASDSHSFAWCGPRFILVTSEEICRSVIATAAEWGHDERLTAASAIGGRIGPDSRLPIGTGLTTSGE
jgi:hypothetical protein